MNKKDLFAVYETAPSRSGSGIAKKLRDFLTSEISRKPDAVETEKGIKLAFISAEDIAGKDKTIGAGSLYAVCRAMKLEKPRIIKREDSHHILEAIVALSL